MKDCLSNGYRMWFAGQLAEDPPWSISYATSRDGVSWNLHEQNPVLKADEYPAFDSEWVIDPDVIGIGDQYFMYYAGHKDALWQGGLARSTDGIHWTRSSSNPLLQTVPGTWESMTCGAQHTVIRNGIFYAFYEGYDGFTRQVGLANSTDGESWTKFPGNPVLGPGEPGAWDASGAKPLSVFVYHETFFLFYSTEPLGMIGLALSENGVLWRKYPWNPILTPGESGAWDSWMSCASVLLDGEMLRLWYCAYGTTGEGWDYAWQIGYAVSPLDTTVLSVRETGETPDRFALIENYPNPFNASTTISFDLPRTAVVVIKVYDILGKKVAALAGERYSPGRHSVRFEAARQSSGVYYCIAEARPEAGLDAEPLRATRAMILMK